MWFNGVHKSGFHAAKSKQHMLFCLLLPPLPELVILLNFSVSRAVSSGSWGSWSHPLFHCSLPFGEVCILFHLDSHRLYVSAQPLRPDLFRHTDRKWGARGLWWPVIAVPLHRGQHFIKNKWLTHGVCLLGWNLTHYKVNCLEPAEPPWKTPEHIVYRFFSSYMS